MQKLIDKAGELRLLILASFRDDERPQLAIECPGTHVLYMKRFGEREIRDVAASMLGRELGSSPAIVTFLQRETEGNAFFLVEAVRELRRFPAGWITSRRKSCPSMSSPVG